jgi:hypothetical protein
MKIYTGWVLKIEDAICTIVGSNTLRGTTYYVLKTANGARKILRDELISGLNSGSIKYVRSVAA